MVPKRSPKWSQKGDFGTHLAPCIATFHEKSLSKVRQPLNTHMQHVLGGGAPYPVIIGYAGLCHVVLSGDVT